MCRIVGIVNFADKLSSELEPVILEMRDSLSHGGPDDAGLFISQDRKVALGHRRLSIIDLSPQAHQPMSNKEQNIWITYNGEIYNFRELRNDLIKSGYDFKSKSDTEILIYGYQEWGIEKLLSRLRGMFAFAIYDSRSGFKLILARDRFGIKPLYYFYDHEKFIFASEIKAFLKSKLIPDEKNLEAMIRFLQLGSVPTPLTTIKNVFSLDAGHYIEVDKSNLKLKEYWNISHYINSLQNKLISQKDAINATSELLLEAAKLHLISDVPLGVFLSGGIDSSSLVALSSKLLDRPLNTLSIVFNEERYSEAKYAQLVANRYKTNHHEVLITNNDFIGELPQIFSAMDEPTIDGVNTYFISKAAKEAGLTVVLSGIGGDEVFLGYEHFKKIKYLNAPINLFRQLPIWMRKNLLNFSISSGDIFGGKSLERLSYLEEPGIENCYLLFRGLFSPGQIQDLLGITETEFKRLGVLFPLQNSSNSLSSVDSLDLLEFKHYLQNQILKDTDFMSMSHGIEIRVPFLDHKLVEYVIGLPSNMKLQNGMNKSLLLNAIRNDLPKEVWARPKMGFTFPFERWIIANFDELQSKCLDVKQLNTKAVKRIWNDFKGGKVHWSRVWALVVLDQFMSQRKGVCANF